MCFGYFSNVYVLVVRYHHFMTAVRVPNIIWWNIHLGFINTEAIMNNTGDFLDSGKANAREFTRFNVKCFLNTQNRIMGAIYTFYNIIIAEIMVFIAVCIFNCKLLILLLTSWLKLLFDKRREERAKTVEVMMVLN